jgi:hypothetical protein
MHTNTQTPSTPVLLPTRRFPPSTIPSLSRLLSLMITPRQRTVQSLITAAWTFPKDTTLYSACRAWMSIDTSGDVLRSTYVLAVCVVALASLCHATRPATPAHFTTVLLLAALWTKMDGRWCCLRHARCLRPSATSPRKRRDRMRRPRPPRVLKLVRNNGADLPGRQMPHPFPPLSHLFLPLPLQRSSVHPRASTPLPTCCLPTLRLTRTL